MRIAFIACPGKSAADPTIECAGSSFGTYEKKTSAQLAYRATGPWLQPWAQFQTLLKTVPAEIESHDLQPPFEFPVECVRTHFGSFTLPVHMPQVTICCGTWSWRWIVVWRCDALFETCHQQKLMVLHRANLEKYRWRSVTVAGNGGGSLERWYRRARPTVSLLGISAATSNGACDALHWLFSPAVDCYSSTDGVVRLRQGCGAGAGAGARSQGARCFCRSRSWRRSST